MKAQLPLAMLLIGAALTDHPRSYLLSIGRIPLNATESIEAFSIKTWGVEFKSVCSIPGAGGSRPETVPPQMEKSKERKPRRYVVQ
ncbi:hypothetical protein PIB19_09330 [Sphingomonas sp. 7/4-4]|uniref:hypothetical protein n=1 Tax=Sphingomonas sp. 7/4-4 TaxID=3018446 RepID=UPI0022F3A1D6|nr:hypothetical protein [Sphingomonas sp. 7/4-4]WBY09480.1 hypothetical protein PIB19_09330 [Sphingomonas sp. 7/4-4]